MGGDSKHGDTTILDCIYKNTITITIDSIRKTVTIGEGQEDRGY